MHWLRYYLQASHSKGHGIHSPFVFEFVSKVLNDTREYYAYAMIESLKKELLLDTRILPVTDYGAGSFQNGSPEKRISDIAFNAVSGRKFGRLLFRLANYYRAKNIVELGSSLGISTAYLASADLSSHVFTMEGSAAIATIARENFIKLKLNNISQVTGPFDDHLPMLIDSNPAADLVFIDGNHRKKPMLNYFEAFIHKIPCPALLIIHDIHWSKEMEEAWSEIQEHPSVKMSIDIFSAGLIFFRNEFQVKQQFIIRF